MPHFIIDCSADVLNHSSAEQIMQAVYESAENSGLFAPNDIKVRLNPFDHVKLGTDKQNFMHIFGHIMSGRSQAQKASLTQAIIEKLDQLLPDLSFLSMNVGEFEPSSYFNKVSLHSRKYRHFPLGKH